MGRSKNNKNNNTSNGLGQARKETRQERRQRILAEAEAREVCFECSVRENMRVISLLFGDNDDQ